MYEPKMKLTEEQKLILAGNSGEMKRKCLESIVRMGDIFEAPNLLEVTHKECHLVTSFGINMLSPLYRIMDELIEDGVFCDDKFTVDPRPLDFKNVKMSLLEKIVGSKIIYGKQKAYEEQLKKIGLKNENAFTCTCYMPEVGNVPNKGDIISWAESSAVVFANSVLGARCNRNSGMFDLFGAVTGFVPNFGLVTDEGRKASWKVIIKTSKKPEAQLLGSAIGMKVVEDVPYVIGLDKFIGNEINDQTRDYLKDFGAATASNGAVGLYHIDNLTPEAKELGDSLIKDDAKTYIIDDEELDRIYKNYPVMWKNKNKDANRVFIGCPHLSFSQLEEWSNNIIDGLNETNNKKVSTRVVLTTSPDVLVEFRKTTLYDKICKTGVRISSVCPLMYTNNPLTHSHRILTNSNKLRTYSMARFKTDLEVLNFITGKENK